MRTAIKVGYVRTLGAPPEKEWRGSDGTINFICKMSARGLVSPLRALGIPLGIPPLEHAAR